MRLDPKVLASVAGSTCCVDYPELVPYLEQLMHATAGRAAAAPQRSQERSAAKREGIRRAVGALPLSWSTSRLVAIVKGRMRAQPSAYGTAGEDVIRDEVRRMKKEAGFGTEGDEAAA